MRGLIGAGHDPPSCHRNPVSRTGSEEQDRRVSPWRSTRHALVCGPMLITDETIAGLRSTATSGELDAARELGRLLCLLPADPAELNLPYLEADQAWPEERWLRAVVNAR